MCKIALLFISLINISSLKIVEAPDVQSTIKDALVLSYLLKIEGAIEVKNKLKDLGYEVYKNGNSESPTFLKYLDNNHREVFSFSIHDDMAISIMHYHLDKGSDFTSRVRSKFSESDFFLEGEDKDEFIFCFPDSGLSNMQSDLNYQYQSKILLNDVVITFFIPSRLSEDEDWIAKIQGLKL